MNRKDKIMKVAVDISPLSSGHKVRGVGQYVRQLKDSLESSDSIHEFIFITNLRQAGGSDVLHIPYFDPFIRHLPFIKRIPTVVTIHDLTPIKFSSHFPVGVKGNTIWHINRRIASSMDAIITDSESSSKDVVDIIKTSRTKVHTVHLAPAKEFNSRPLTKDQRGLLKKFNLPEKFVLYVGDVTWNKNVPRIIEACIKAEVPIVVAGKAIANTDYDRSHPWNYDLVSAQKLLDGYENAVVLGFVTDEELRALYKEAVVLLFPSLYEGFGLPVVEAMASSCPVITSQEGSLAEVGGNAVYYVDPYSVESISDGIRDVFDSKSVQSQLKKSGLAQSAKFTWKKTTDETISIYEKAVVDRSL